MKQLSEGLDDDTLRILLKAFQDYEDTTWYTILFDIFQKTRHNKQVKKD
jgi:hypothetical protein